MRVFTFFLMMVVAVGGTLGGHRLITGRDLLNLDDLGLRNSAGPSSQVADTRVTTVPTAVPSPTPVPTPPPPTPTAVPDTTRVMVVGNTGGQGVYLRRTPNMADRVQAWVDGTKMEVIGNPVESEGRKWMKVRAPNGVEGYIPEQYLLTVP